MSRCNAIQVRNTAKKAPQGQFYQGLFALGAIATAAMAILLGKNTQF